MLPVVTIVGRPNVGKSTLFNRLTQTRNAIISAYPGTTRDRQYGEVNLHQRHFIIVDTGGFTQKTDEIGELTSQQSLQAMQDADKIVFVIDGKEGITPEDHLIANLLRRSGLNKPIFLVVNKTENKDPQSLLDSYELGFSPILFVAAAHGIGIDHFLETLFPESDKQEKIEEEQSNCIKLAIVGRPNVGKSTLTNRMLGEDRVIVHDSPGTTRDSILIPLTRFDKHYQLIDTAGVRKRKNISELPEKFSVVKTLQAIEQSHVVLYVVDGRAAVAEQDLKLLGFVVESGKGLVIAVNKWDGMQEDARQHAKNTIDRHFHFVRFARLHYISALHGSGVGNLFESVNEAYASATKKLSTSELTRLLQKALTTHSPPLVHGRRIKLRYAHPGGHNPPLIVIHGNQVGSLPESYRKFLVHFFQTQLNLFGTPIHLQFKSSANPYSSKK